MYLKCSKNISLNSNVTKPAQTSPWDHMDSWIILNYCLLNVEIMISSFLIPKATSSRLMNGKLFEQKDLRHRVFRSTTWNRSLSWVNYRLIWEATKGFAPHTKRQDVGEINMIRNWSHFQLPYTARDFRVCATARLNARSQRRIVN